MAHRLTATARPFSATSAPFYPEFSVAAGDPAGDQIVNQRLQAPLCVVGDLAAFHEANTGLMKFDQFTIAFANRPANHIVSVARFSGSTSAHFARVPVIPGCKVTSGHRKRTIRTARKRTTGKDRSRYRAR
jgi:hypothetical protein